jgi:acetylornithine aminotransferase
MKLFNVYPLYDVCLVKAKGMVLIDDNGEEYLDFYGGHAVISVGHAHPHYIDKLKAQLDSISYYSNSVINPIQEQLAKKLGQVSGCANYDLFLCNSGAEANENALKLASFATGKSRILAFKNSFHGRTSAAVAATDNPSIQAALNRQHKVTFLTFNDTESLQIELAKGDVCAVIIECIQGVGGLDEPATSFLIELASLCKEHNALLIADEVQSGFGRSGQFFAFQHHHIAPDIISMAKGMGNGFPVAGILINQRIEASYGLLGTTFGGNHLACSAAFAVLEIIEKENLIAHAAAMDSYFRKKAEELPEIVEIKGRGLMLGFKFDFEIADLRQRLIFNQHIFTGGSKDKKLLRILPPLNINTAQVDLLFAALKKELQ